MQMNYAQFFRRYFLSPPLYHSFVTINIIFIERVYSHLIHDLARQPWSYQHSSVHNGTCIQYEMNEGRLSRMSQNEKNPSNSIDARRMEQFDKRNFWYFQTFKFNWIYLIFAFLLHRIFIRRIFLTATFFSQSLCKQTVTTTAIVLLCVYSEALRLAAWTRFNVLAWF